MKNKILKTEGLLKKIINLSKKLQINKTFIMKHGARNTIKAKVTSVKKGEIMSLVKFEVTVPVEMSSVLTTESLDELNIRIGEEINLAVKAVHVLPYKE